MRQQRAREVDVGPSVSRNTINVVPIVVEGFPDGVPSIDLAGSGKSDPPAF